MFFVYRDLWNYYWILAFMSPHSSECWLCCLCPSKTPTLPTCNLPKQLSVLSIFNIYLITFNNLISIVYSNTPEKPFTGSLALNEKLSGASKLFENQIKGPEGLLYHGKTLYTTLHYGHVVKIVDDEIIPVVKFGKVCGVCFYFDYFERFQK